MKRAFVIAIGLCAAPAAAQPVTRPDACGVTLAYAPEDVRAVLEDYLAREPSCSSTLEIRVVPTDGGLYLFARDEHGRVRERVVPDAESAAVLVASWMADDSRPAPPPPLEGLPHHVPAPAPAPTLVPNTTLDPFDRGPDETAHTSAGHWLALGPIAAGRGHGVRAELDVHSWGAWTMGIAAVAVDNEALAMYVDGSGLPMTAWMDVVDASGLAFLTRRLDLGGWRLRPSAAIGFTYTQTSVPITDSTDPWNPYTYTIGDEGIVPTAELALLLGHSLGERWQIDVGPGVTFFADGPGELTRKPQTSLYAAVRYRL